MLSNHVNECTRRALHFACSGGRMDVRPRAVLLISLKLSALSD
jgi:hypothetical protein